MQSEIYLKSTVYNDALIRLLSRQKDKEPTKEYFKKIVLYGTKTINKLPIDENCSFEKAQSYFNSICFVKSFMMKITPNDFENIFPIQKIYDGELYQCKDYFYTKKFLDSLDKFSPIGEKLEELLWEYVNDDIRAFNMKCFKVLDILRKYEGKRSIIEEWANMNGIKTYTLKKDGLGKEYLYDKQTGRTMKIKKKRPRYLKLIK